MIRKPIYCLIYDNSAGYINYDVIELYERDEADMNLLDNLKSEFHVEIYHNIYDVITAILRIINDYSFNNWAGDNNE